ncbi:MAG: hypothetical protein M3144_05535, partial [Actinomycetota bacterium]|nr:hypothetical protein [Actinomycetota bacterium]
IPYTAGVAEDVLAGKVAIVPVGDVAAAEAPALARRLAAEGATVVLVAGPDALTRSGRLASQIEAAGDGRPAVFALDPSDPAGQADDADPAGPLVEFLAELFGPAERGAK